MPVMIIFKRAEMRETHARCMKLGRPGEGCAVPLPEIFPVQATKLHGLRDDICNLVGRAHILPVH